MNKYNIFYKMLSIRYSKCLLCFTLSIITFFHIINEINGVSTFPFKQKNTAKKLLFRDFNSDFNRRLSDNSIEFIAIGDWGATPPSNGDGSRFHGQRAPAIKDENFYRAYNAQKHVAELLAKVANNDKTELIISHGDNFYWNGVGIADAKERFSSTFENIYYHEHINKIKWISVMGNHDVAGGGYICGDRDGAFRACQNIEELLFYLEKRFTSQNIYKSPINNRWAMSGIAINLDKTDKGKQEYSHYYKTRIEKNGIVVDIYNIDTNIAGNHGAEQICCQCFGYAGRDCHFGDNICMGGNKEMFYQCMNRIKEWHDESLNGVINDIKKDKESNFNVDWRIINSHYPITHLAEPEREKWLNLLKNEKIQIFINGHIHGQSHNYISDIKTHFITNGAGGGILNEGGNRHDTSFFAGNEYGFYKIDADKEYIRLSYITFDGSWKFKPPRKVGDARVSHCYMIPKDGSIGKPC